MNSKKLFLVGGTLTLLLSIFSAAVAPSQVSAYKCTGETDGVANVYQDGACYDAAGNLANDTPVHNDGTSIRNWECATGTYNATTRTCEVCTGANCQPSTSTPVPAGRDTTPNEDGSPAEGEGSPADKDSATKGVGGSGECAGVKTDFLACDGEGFDAITGIVRIVVIIVSVGVGIVAVGGIVYGALLYASAQDNQDQVGRAIKVIRNVVIGILLYSFMVAILNWLIPGGVISVDEGSDQAETTQPEDGNGTTTQPGTTVPNET